MTTIPESLKYTSEHEWVETMSGGRVRVGITDFAQRQLGDIVFVEQPKVGDRFEAGEPFGSVESVKSVTEVYTPVTGQVTARNDRLGDQPELMNDDPYGEGWLIEISLTNPSPDGLLSAKEYGAYITSED
ncbi:glycine cleavage system protein GcvH [Streptomyces phaeoluteigriseus]|uniref:Glycine cleavage system H protein n=1 Tax=Streptomyces phaeoluteigriseus TaxID=114686 RepID=A0ABY4ZAA0_9ACTN|nr:glycine cleavage system protein GcvH [Streptomyces phaeoluteigriseus]USQ85620.1 glycine cleavage system protein GcvH [Streptomyces phaeoluteigriseus]